MALEESVTAESPAVTPEMRLPWITEAPASVDPGDSKRDRWWQSCTPGVIGADVVPLHYVPDGMSGKKVQRNIRQAVAADDISGPGCGPADGIVAAITEGNAQVTDRARKNFTAGDIGADVIAFHEVVLGEAAVHRAPVYGNSEMASDGAGVARDNVPGSRRGAADGVGCYRDRDSTERAIPPGCREQPDRWRWSRSGCRLPGSGSPGRFRHRRSPKSHCPPRVMSLR